MSFGQGFGVPFGGPPLVPLASPRSAVGDDLPVAFDFTDEPDGPLPGAWEFFVLSDNGAGLKSTSAEGNPTFYFRVVGGRGWWRYTRQPSLPPPATPFDERGLVASPAGILFGPNAELAVAFVQPVLLLDPNQDEFIFEILLGYRGSDDGTGFVGARARAAWTAGIWTTPIALEAVRALSGAAPTVLASALFPSTNQPTDIWNANPSAELRVNIRHGELKATLNAESLAMVSAPIPNTRASKPIVMVRVYGRLGALLTSVPCLLGLQLRSLRDLERLGPTPAIKGDADLEAAQLPVMRLPLNDLVAKGFFKRTGARSWVCVQEVEADVFGLKHLFRVGELVRSVETIGATDHGQEMHSVVADLSAMRAARERELV